jgi:hypothetical protein
MKRTRTSQRVVAGAAEAARASTAQKRHRKSGAGAGAATAVHAPPAKAAKAGATNGIARKNESAGACCVCASAARYHA